jgi:hypothetical protein
MVNSSIVITEGSSNSPETPTAEQADTPMRHHDRHGTTPESTKTSLRQRLLTRARERWPQLATLHVRHRGAFAYVGGELPDGATMPLFRLRYGGSATAWAFATYRASHNDYQTSILPNGYPVGTPQEALDCACGLYLNDAAAWQSPN